NALGKKALDFLFTAQKDSVSSLIIDNDAYKVIKLLDSKEGEDTYVNAAHILINFGADTAAAKKKAEDILKRVKAGEDFSKLAVEVSEDPSAKSNNGDLGWFTKGAMVKEFEDACMNGKPGEYAGPVKTQFGYHIIKVKAKSKKEFRIAEVKKPVVASARTKEIARKKAADFIKEMEKGQGGFLSCSKVKVNFDTLARQYQLFAMSTPEVIKGGNVPGAGPNANLVDFGLKNGLDKLYGPVKVQGGYGVYMITNKTSEGLRNFDSVKTGYIKPKVQQQKKFDIMLTKANELKGKINASNFESLKAQNPTYIFDKADSLSMQKPDSKIGMDYQVYNAIMNLKPGEVSAPVKGARGYYIIIANYVKGFDQNDYLAKQGDIRKQMLSSKQQSAIQDWVNNLKNKSDIEDNRDRYYN
ncbi:hypothetical protein D4R20_00730, partial [bacterium]